jgi:hypothetical protein
MVKKISAHVLQCIDVAMFAGGHCKGRVISGNFNFSKQLVCVHIFVSAHVRVQKFVCNQVRKCVSKCAIVRNQ